MIVLSNICLKIINLRYVIPDNPTDRNQSFEETCCLYIHSIILRRKVKAGAKRRTGNTRVRLYCTLFPYIPRCFLPNVLFRHPQDGGSRSLRNAGDKLPDYKLHN